MPIPASRRESCIAPDTTGCAARGRSRSTRRRGCIPAPPPAGESVPESGVPAGCEGEGYHAAVAGEVVRPRQPTVVSPFGKIPPFLRAPAKAGIRVGSVAVASNEHERVRTMVGRCRQDELVPNGPEGGACRSRKVAPAPFELEPRVGADVLVLRVPHGDGLEQIAAGLHACVRRVRTPSEDDGEPLPIAGVLLARERRRPQAGAAEDVPRDGRRIACVEPPVIHVDGVASAVDIVVVGASVVPAPQGAERPPSGGSRSCRRSRRRLRGLCNRLPGPGSGTC
jgi:hypothetical protein